MFRNTKFTIFFTFIVLAAISCKLLGDDEGINYEVLREALIEENDSLVVQEINKITVNLYPYSNNGDPFGHRENFETLITKIEANGNSGLQASLLCYACIETAPAISEVLIIISGSDEEIERVIDIQTSANDRLNCVGVHR